MDTQERYPIPFYFGLAMNSVVILKVLSGFLLWLAWSVTPVSAETIVPRTTPFDSTFEKFSRSVWYISDGWRNGGHQNCTWSRKAVSFNAAEGLTLSYLPDGTGDGEALCGEVQTRSWFQYGTFEVKVRAEPGSGLNAAFFAFTGKVHGQPHDEIDFELLSKAPGLVWLNRFVGGKDFGEGEEHRFDPGTPDTYHDFAFIWEPDRLRWYVNGGLAREVTEGVPSHPMKVYFSHWGSDSFPNWMGRFERPAAPVTMNVSRFQYTPLGQSCVFEGSISCRTP